jgi:predicted RNase H-like nuclease (RuvC/YqgF family)
MWEQENRELRAEAARLEEELRAAKNTIDLMRPYADEIERLRRRSEYSETAYENLKIHCEELQQRIEELERELNPDPEAHLMGWEADDE